MQVRVLAGMEIGMRDTINRMKTKGQAEESVYLLEYEKQRLTTCAKSFEDLAKVFVYIPEKEVPEKETDRQTMLWRKRLNENRELLADNLKEMAVIMGQVARKDIHAVWFPEKKKKQMIQLLEEEGLCIRDIYCLESGQEQDIMRSQNAPDLLSETEIQNMSKHPGLAQLLTQGKSTYSRVREYENHKVALMAKAKKDCRITSEEMAGFLSILLDRHLQPCFKTPFYIPEEYTSLYFEEEAAFNVMTGFAKATKETEKISGDNYSFFETDDNCFMAILSDGMGSGEKACADSETVVSMAEKFMDAGFSMESTVQMINDALLAGTDNNNMSTLDLCSVDLHTGKSSFIKIGSAATYIKRGNEVEKIPSVSLPLGIFHQLDITTQRRDLGDGDYIIMLSDGIADCLSQGEGEQFLKELISGLKYQRPAEIAGCIMKYVLSLNRGRIRDDMTVLVMGFWENRYDD